MGEDFAVVTVTIIAVHYFFLPLKVQPRNGQNSAPHHDELIGLT